MNSTLPLLIDYLTSQCWAINYETLQQMADIVDRHLHSIHLSDEEISAITQPKRTKGSDNRQYEVTADGRAIIPVSGLIAKYSRMVNGCSQPRGTSIETLRSQLYAAMNDKYVNSIFLHIESPGGYMDGLADFANEVYQASFEKPVIGFADDLCASAAYWIGSQVNKLYANQTAYVGSIGVYTLYVDSSARAEQLGFKFHIIRSGQHKGVGATGVQITEENLAAIQERINDSFEIFIQAILKARALTGLDEETLRNIADGNMYVGKKAKNLNLVDGIMTFEQAITSELPAVRSQGIVAAVPSANNLTNQSKKETQMEKETLQTDAAASQEKLRNEAAAAERARITSIQSALDGDHLKDARNKAIAEGLSLTEAKAMAFEAEKENSAKEKSALQTRLDDAQAKLDAIAEGGSDVTASESVEEKQNEANAGKNAADDGKAETYEGYVNHLIEKGEKKANAYKLAAKKLPKCHEAWKQAHTS